MQDEIEAGDEVDDSDEDFPDDDTRGVGFEGEDEMSDAADDHQPAKDESDGDAGEGWNANCEESGDNEKDAEGDGPVDGFRNETGEAG